MVTRRLAPTAIVLALVLLLGVVPASSSPDSLRRDDRRPSQSEVLSRTVSADPSATRDYWTKQRMRAATPVELVAAEGTPQLGSDGPAPEGEPLIVPQVLPNAGRGTTKRSMSAVATCTGPIACTTGEITNTAAFPNITHGKVFFTDPGPPAVNFVCSGTVVNSTNESVVWTAGHCVHGGPGEGFFTNWMFAPGFRNGNQPEGRWTAKELWTTTAWGNNGNNSFDLAAAVIARKGGKTIQDAVGARGIAFNMDLEDEAIRAIGHPAVPNPPFNGQRMHFCDSTIDLFDTNFPMPHPLGTGCDMEGGSSGGGWIHDGDTVVSNVSYGYPNSALEDVLFGPQLTDTAEAVYNAASTADTQPPRITKVSDKPDPFTPNGDGKKDVTRIRFTVNEDFDLVLTIKRGGKNAVRLVSNNRSAGSYVFIWNGRKNNSGKKVKSGKNTYSIKATDDDGNSATKSGKSTVRR